MEEIQPELGRRIKWAEMGVERGDRCDRRLRGGSPAAVPRAPQVHSFHKRGKMKIAV